MLLISAVICIYKLLPSVLHTKFTCSSLKHTLINTIHMYKSTVHNGTQDIDVKVHIKIFSDYYTSLHLGPYHRLVGCLSTHPILHWPACKEGRALRHPVEKPRISNVPQHTITNNTSIYLKVI